MAYEVKYLINGQYTLGDFRISNGEQKEVSEELFKYLSSTFGDSGWFTFHETKPATKAEPKKRAPRKPRAKKVAEPEVTAEK